MSEAGEYSDLCLNCGLCCSGVIFATVKLAPDERMPARLMGLDMLPDGLGFSQPCSCFHAQNCTIYDMRPAACRKFRCELLKKLAAGEVPPDEAEQTIKTALKLINEIEAGDCGSAPQLLRSASANPDVWRAGDPAGLHDRASRHVTLMALERYLDSHFRRPDKQKLKKQ